MCAAALRACYDAAPPRLPPRFGVEPLRRAHWLRANHKSEFPHDCVWFDTETQERRASAQAVRHVLDFGHAAYRRRLGPGRWSAPKWLRFETPEAFWAWVFALRKGKSRLTLFCHNAAFDLPVLDAFALLPAAGWKLKTAIIDSPPVILKYRREGQTLQFLDTLNFWRQKLSVIGETMGLPKLPMPAPDADRSTWNAYCRRDVEIIMAACLRWFAFLQEHDLGGFAPTLASQAMRAFRHRFLTDPILIDSNEDALALARAAYLGGRVECFRLGPLTGPLTLYDINAHYPHCMSTQRYPVRLMAHCRHPKVDEVAAWIGRYCVVARCTLATDEPVYPLEYEDKLVFPVGEFETTLATPELRHALDHGYVKTITHIALYQSAPIFWEYVHELYGLRLAAVRDGNKVLAWQCKKLLQSLYGKFGQRGRVYETVTETPDGAIGVWTEIDAETGEVRNLRQFGGLIQEQKTEGESRDSHPAIAAHVTAYGRMALWGWMQRAGRSHVLYIDTDSLLVDAVGAENLASAVDPDALGQLKIEGVFASGHLYGLKDYRFGETVRTKGVRANAHWIDANTVEQEHWSTLIGLLRKGDLSAPIVERRTKHLRRVYTKGCVQSDGSIRPLRLPIESPGPGFRSADGLDRRGLGFA